MKKTIFRKREICIILMFLVLAAAIFMNVDSLSNRDVNNGQTGVNMNLPTWFDDITSVNEPWSNNKITTANELAQLAYNVTVGGNDYEGVTFTMENDIDLSGKLWLPIGVDTKKGSTTVTHPFKGVFDGGQHYIKAMTVETRSEMFDDQYAYGKVQQLGLFGYVADGGSVHDVIVDGNSSIILNNDVEVYVGGVVAETKNASIYNCVNYASITQDVYSNYNMIAGGVIGRSVATNVNEYPVVNCSNYGNITVNKLVTELNNDNYKVSPIGGVIATIATGSIYNCYNVGDVVMNYANLATLTQSYETAVIAGIANRVSAGGSTKIYNCYNSGSLYTTWNDGEAYVISATTGQISGKFSSITINDAVDNCFIAKFADTKEVGFFGSQVKVNDSHTTIRNIYQVESNKNTVDPITSGVRLTTSHDTLINGLNAYVADNDAVNGIKLKNWNNTSAFVNNGFPYFDWSLYTVNFNTKGVSFTNIAAQQKAPGALVENPGNPIPTDAKYTFTGWYKNVACDVLWNFDTDVVSKNTTLYAGWLNADDIINNSCTISGTILDEYNSVVAQAKITIKLGAQEVKTTYSDNNGSFIIDNLSKGLYNIVCQAGKSTTTIAIDLQSTVDDYFVTVPGANLGSVVSVADDAPAVVVDGINDLFNSSDLSNAETGKTVAYKIDISVVSTKTIIEQFNAAANGRVLSSILNIQLDKSIDETETNLPTSPKLLTIYVPIEESMQGQDKYTIIRMHEGEIQYITAKANDNGEYIEISEDGKSVIMHVQNFSEYALAVGSEPVSILKNYSWIIFISAIIIAALVVFLVWFFVKGNGRQKIESYKATHKNLEKAFPYKEIDDLKE